MRKTLMIGLAAAALAAPVQADYSNTVASLGPLAYWRLDETVAPPQNIATNSGTLGAAAHGYYINGANHPLAPGAVAAGADSGAVFPNLDGNRVAVPFHPAMALNQPFSVEFWAFPFASEGTLCPAALTWFGGDGARSGWLFYQNGAAGWTFRTYGTGNTGFNATAEQAVTPGSWYHIVGVYDGANTKIYVNGARLASVAATSYVPITRTDVPFTVGARGNGSLGFFHYNGGVDEAAYYTNALTDAEILAHYQNGVSTSPATPYQQLVAAKNPLVYLRLNEPEFVAPDPSALPVAKNSGSLADEADGRYLPGTLPGVDGVPYSGMGANNKATRFGPTYGSGYIDAGASESLNFLSSFSLVTWFKSGPADARFMTFIGKGDSSWRAGMDDQGRMRFAYGGNGDATGTLNMNDGQWHQLTGVYDGATLTMYVDGVVQAVQNAATVPEGSTSILPIGSVSDYLAARVFNGSMDEVAVFDKALTLQEVRTIYYSANVPPLISVQPTAPATINEGQTVSLVAGVIGSPALGYQWFKGGVKLDGKTSTNLTLTSVVLADSGAYSLVATNPYGAVTSAVVTVNIQAGPPLVVADPLPVSRYTGQPASFTVSAGGSFPLTYQWLKDGNAIGGATAASLTIDPVLAASFGDYACKITNPHGSVTSKVARLTVVTAPTASYPSVVLADSPIAYWRLGETTGTNAHDYVGGFTGTYRNVALGRPGYASADPDKAAQFGPAINSHVADINGVDFATNGGLPSFTIEAWVKGGAQTSDAGIVTKGTGAGGEQFNLDTGAGNRAFRFFVRNAGGGAHLCSSPIIPDGQWHHVVGTLDGASGTLTLYVDGVSYATASIGLTAGILATPQPMSIGSRQGGTGPFDTQFDGTIDEVAIYAHALDATKVAEHYAARFAAGSLPAIAVQPTSTTNYVTLTTVLSVTADGPDGLAYQWKRNGVDIDGAVEPSLTLSALDIASGGDYTVVISNPYGSVTSSVAKLTVLPAPTSVDLSEGLVLHLPFDGSLSDTSGRNNHGTNVGATAISTGMIGSGALSYATDVGANSYNYVTLGKPSDLKFSSNVNFSVAYWIKLPAGARPQDLPVLCSTDNSAFGPGITFAPSWETGAWSWTLYNAAGGGVGVYGADDTINDGEWHHVAHTFDRSGYGITYLNGVQVDSRSVAGVGDVDRDAVINIGQSATGRYEVTAESVVDDLGVWRRVLTPLEVGAMYVGGVTSGISFSSAPVNLSVVKAGGQLQLTWPGGGTLQAAGTVSGTFTNVSGATSPHTVTPSAAEFYYRIKVQ